MYPSGLILTLEWETPPITLSLTTLHSPELIGFPKELSASQSGELDWHPSGSIFVGSGISEKNIPFSYNANWDSAGRWWVEFLTKENRYIMKPMEQLFVQKRGSIALGR